MFLFGDGPHAQAGRAGLELALQNRRDITRQNELEADYAFRTNQMENAAAQNMAALARAQQQEQNQLAREAFMFREQEKQQAKADAFAKMQFDAKRKDIEREFTFAEKDDAREKAKLDEDLENSGASLSYALSQLRPVADAAKAQRDRAAAEEAAIIRNATAIGYGYDSAKKKITGVGRFRSADDYNNDLNNARMNLKEAIDALKPVEQELSIAERQARQLGFSVTPEAIQHIRRGKVFPIRAKSTAVQSAPTMEFPTGTVGSVTPPDDRGMEIPSQQSRYIIGRVYGGQRFLGGDPNSPASWQPVTR